MSNFFIKIINDLFKTMSEVRSPILIWICWIVAGINEVTITLLPGNNVTLPLYCVRIFDCKI